jgi:hypothetical protein
VLNKRLRKARIADSATALTTTPRAQRPQAQRRAATGAATAQAGDVTAGARSQQRLVRRRWIILEATHFGSGDSQFHRVRRA